MKKLILIGVITIIPLSLFAQRPGGQFDRMKKPRREQIEMLRIWKMTEELDLSEKQAEKFFPKLRNEDKKIEELENQRQKIYRELNEIWHNADRELPALNEVRAALGLTHAGSE